MTWLIATTHFSERVAAGKVIAACLFVALLGALLIGYRYLKRELEIERADALLEADFKRLETEVLEIENESRARDQES